jgi:hypothetical protein
MAYVMVPQLRAEINKLSGRLSKKLGYNPAMTPEVNAAFSANPQEYVQLIRKAASGKTKRR